MSILFQLITVSTTISYTLLLLLSLLLLLFTSLSLRTSERRTPVGWQAQAIGLFVYLIILYLLSLWQKQLVLHWERANLM